MFQFEDFDPFEFKCDYCGKSHVFSEKKIEKVKKKVPGTKNDYYILCQFCQKGHMRPPEIIMFG